MEGHLPIEQEPRSPGLLAKAACTAVMVGIVLCIALQVLNRHVVHFQMPWTEEVSRILLLWVACLGAIFAAADRAHFRMDLLASNLPVRTSRRLGRLVSALTALFLLLFAYAGLRFCVDQSDNISQILGISRAIPAAAIPLSAAAMALIPVIRFLYARWNPEN